MAAREPLLSNIRRAIAREAVIFMLIAAAIGSIGYATVRSRIIVGQPGRVFQVLRHISIHERIPETF
jgi:hypothetical protein